MEQNRNNWLLKILICVFIISCLQSCNNEEPVKWKIGFSQSGDIEYWRKYMLEEMKRELTFHPEMELIYKQANNNSKTQIEQVRAMMNEGIDLLIISAYESTPLTSVVEEVYKKGIPVIVVDRKIDTDTYSSFIGADNYEIGKIAARYAALLLNGKGNVIEITGLQTSSPAQDRQKGFGDALNAMPQMHLLTTINGNWLESGVEAELPKLKRELLNTQLIYAHNDISAAAAAKICNELKLTDIKIIGIDALPGQGLDFVDNRTITASVMYPTGGSEAIRTAANILQKKSFAKREILKTIVVDSSNVNMLKQQADKILSQQNDILRQENILAVQTKTFKTQSTLIYILLMSSLLLFTVAILLVRSRKDNIRKNKLLVSRNEEISIQNEKIVEMAAEAEKNNELRLNFFTNISHDLKTPLTLILAPTEQALENTKLPFQVRNQLSLVKKNATKLMLMVNQLMDFRKIQLNKVHLQMQKVELISFINGIVYAYYGLSKQKNIDCRLITKQSNLWAWIDPEKIEKVFFNLLSNAFNFTENGGFIYIFVELDAEKDLAVIKIQDSGIGMTEDVKAHLFEIYYQGNYQNFKGSGLGLALAKNLTELNHGNISVESEYGKGATFTLTLPLIDKLAIDDATTENQVYNSKINDWIEQYSLEDITPAIADATEENMPIDKGNNMTILVVEDDADMLGFLTQKLNNNFNVIVAKDGAEGIKSAFEDMPDIIISDVMMPKKDGIELAKILKSDIRTAHIPIILLTAKSNEDQMLQGLRSKVDAYITKPFTYSILEGTLQSILDNRNKIKEHYTAAIPTEKIADNKKGNKAFIASFTAIVEKNIPNDKFSVQDICQEMNISKVQLYRKIKAAMDININDYILNVRIQKAKYYLQYENLTIAEVAYKTGFATPSYFSTIFKKITDETPTAFRNKFGK